MIGCSPNLINIGTGFFATWLTAYMLAAPWILIIYPVIVSVRGNIGGVFAARISTALYTGEVKPKFKGNTMKFKQIVSFVQLLNIINIFFSALMVIGISFLLRGEIFEFSLVLAVISTSMLFTIVISVINTCIGAFASFRMGYDPDAVTYPFTSTTDDVIIVLVYNFVAWVCVYFREIFIFLVNLIILPLVLLVTLILTFRYLSWEDLKKDAKCVPLLLITSTIATFSGHFLKEIEDKISEIPLLFALYSPLADISGDQTSTTASDLTTKLSIGTIEAKVSTILKDKSFTKYIFAEYLAGNIYLIIELLTFGLILVPTDVADIVRVLFIVLVADIWIISSLIIP
ncbi:MAG: magnesium transporter, partial [Candidatus Korarchaeota archaeon]